MYLYGCGVSTFFLCRFTLFAPCPQQIFTEGDGSRVGCCIDPRHLVTVKVHLFLAEAPQLKKSVPF